jgi:co-chaperonin GroES (HSP10)
MNPLKNYVLVKETKQESTTSSGIVLTGSISQGPNPGIVAAIGPDVNESIKKGDKVVLAWDKGLRVSSDSALISDEFILAVY